MTRQEVVELALVLAAVSAVSGCCAPASAPVGVAGGGAGGADRETLVFDLSDTLHPVTGFGVHVWADQPHGLAELRELNIGYIRITKDQSTWSQLQSARAITDRDGVKWLYMLWRAPEQYVDGRDYLTDIRGFALYWREVVAELDSHGVRPHYVELMNEPDSDGTWSTRIAPADYAELVRLTRAELDAAGFADVGIVGPGLAHLNWNQHNSQWIDAIDRDAADALAAWSTHCWDDGDLCHGGAECVEEQWPEFHDPAKRIDPAKPIWVTEYSTKELSYGDRSYPHPDQTDGYSSAHSMPYAVRACEISLALLNSGANVIFYWHAEDMGKSWGYVDATGKHKPIYHVLRNLYPKIPLGARVLRPSMRGGSVYGAAFVQDGRLVIALANDGLAPRRTTVHMESARSLRVIDAQACILTHEGDPAAEEPDTCEVVQLAPLVRNGNLVEVTLRGYSTLTMVCEVADGGARRIDLPDPVPCAPAAGQVSASSGSARGGASVLSVLGE